ncbi:MAG: DUF1501 domain-containing protein, partial [Chloroflexi bacterium]|nr:DUF1501 domain-containing protein [Chloroflexota bacterium]
MIFLFLRGAPSHVDTFDFKHIDGVTPSDLSPETFGDITIPTGILENTTRVLDKIAIVRSGLAWARAHPLAQSWMQVGRNPTSATGRIAPHIGSVVALEKEPSRLANQVFPSFIALHPQNVAGAGYFPVAYAPFRTYASADGLGSADHPSGQETFTRRWGLLEQLEAGFRGDNQPFGTKVGAMGEMYENARSMMFNSAVESAFTFTEEESTRYGSTAFGDSVLVARKIIEQDQGTRFIQIDHSGWDHHVDIYGTQDLDPQSTIYAQSAEFDPAFAALIEDLETSGKLSETLVVVCGEFGRTPGSLSAAQSGRDHYLQMFYVFAGGGIQGGTVIGATNDTGGPGAGSFTTETGWSRERDIRPEDVEATIYSAL